MPLRNSTGPVLETQSAHKVLGIFLLSSTITIIADFFWKGKNYFFHVACYGQIRVKKETGSSLYPQNCILLNKKGLFGIVVMG